MKKKLLIGIAALSLMGMVACNLPELSVGEDNATGLEATADDDYYEWLDETYESHSESENIALYENYGNLYLGYWIGEQELTGKIENLAFGKDYILTSNNDVMHYDRDDVQFHISDGCKDFYSFPLDSFYLITENTDGSYSFYCDSWELECKFQIEEGVLLDAYNSGLTNLVALIRTNDRIIANFYNMETGELTDTCENFEIVRDDHEGWNKLNIQIGQVLPCYSDGPFGSSLYITDTEGNLYCQESYLSYDEHGDPVITLTVDDSNTIANVDKLLTDVESSYKRVPVYTKTDDASHIYILNSDFSDYTEVYTETALDLPEGYTTGDIEKFLSFEDDYALFILNDKSVYYCDIKTNECNKLEQLSVLNQEGHVIEFGADLDPLVLMDDNTIYEIVNY